MPGFRFPMALKIGALIVNTAPALSVLDHFFEFRKFFKGNRRGEVNILFIQQSKYVSIKKAEFKRDSNRVFPTTSFLVTSKHSIINCSTASEAWTFPGLKRKSKNYPLRATVQYKL